MNQPIETVVNLNKTKLRTLYKFQVKISELQFDQQLRELVINFLSQEVNYYNLNEHNKSTIKKFVIFLSSVGSVGFNVQDFNFEDPQLVEFLNCISNL